MKSCAGEFVLRSRLDEPYETVVIGQAKEVGRKANVVRRTVAMDARDRCSVPGNGLTDDVRDQLRRGTAYDGIGAPVAPRSLSGKPRNANSYCFSAAISSMSTTSMIWAPAVVNMYACTGKKTSSCSEGSTSSAMVSAPMHIAPASSHSHFAESREMPGVFTR